MENREEKIKTYIELTKDEDKVTKEEIKASQATWPIWYASE